ncbi:MAG: glycosyl transferase, partial [Rhodobacteraceae bacterium]|nr:glycosyl transferase [Paracoccaceae bacterium]
MTRVSIIVALYRETEMVEQLLRQIARLRYPKTLIEVLLMIEEGDTATLNELDRLKLTNIITVHILPAGPIMTKP